MVTIRAQSLDLISQISRTLSLISSPIHYEIFTLHFLSFGLLTNEQAKLSVLTSSLSTPKSKP